ncbi:MAG: M16 family metallopeptidase [Pseudobdellovibrionaceae bacterium]
MKNKSLVFTLPLICSVLASCTSVQKQSGSTVPVGYISKDNGSFKLQPFKELVLENGLRIIFVRDNHLPRLSLTLMIRTGSMQEAEDKAGLNALTAYLLEQGTQSRNAIKIADDFGQLGSSLDVMPGADVTTLYSDSLITGADSLLDLFVDVTSNPSFKEAEISRLRAQMVAGLQKKVDDPSVFIDSRMDQFLFDKHPYGRDIKGTPNSLKAISKQDIIKHYLTFYRPNNSSLAVVGNFDEDFEKRVQEAFGKWTKRTIPEVKTAEPPAIDGLKVKLIVKKGLQQTQIRISGLGIARSNEDYLRLRLANEVLGGGFASRLNQKVRDDLGLTYSIQSYFDVRKEKGSFDVTTFSKNETAGKTLDETLNVITDYANGGAQDSEIMAARNLLIGQFPRAIETADRLAYNLLVLDFYGISFDYLTNFNKSIGEFKTNEINKAFKKVVDPTKLKVLVYGDEKIVTQFEKYKPEIERVK